MTVAIPQLSLSVRRFSAQCRGACLQRQARSVSLKAGQVTFRQHCDLIGSNSELKSLMQVMDQGTQHMTARAYFAASHRQGQGEVQPRHPSNTDDTITGLVLLLFYLAMVKGGQLVSSGRQSVVGVASQVVEGFFCIPQARGPSLASINAVQGCSTPSMYL